jgi:hypothetical protein
MGMLILSAYMIEYSNCLLDFIRNVSLYTYCPLAHVDFEPLLDGLSAHWALTRPNREMGMLDGNHHIGTPLTQNHVATW